MLKLSLFITALFLISCKTEFHRTIEKYPNDKLAIEYVYPDKNDTSKYAYVAYFKNGDTMFKAEVNDLKFVEKKINYYDNGKIESIETLYKPTALDDSLYDCEIMYFTPEGNPFKNLHYKDGVKALPAKYWLNSGIILTGIYKDRLHKEVLWRWYDKNDRLIKQQIDFGNEEAFTNPME